MTRRKFDFKVCTCLSLERAVSMSVRGETVFDPTDGARGDVEEPERSGTGGGAFVGAVSKLSAAELPDAIDEPTVEEAALATERPSSRDDDTRT